MFLGINTENCSNFGICLVVIIYKNISCFYDVSGNILKSFYFSIHKENVTELKNVFFYSCTVSFNPIANVLVKKLRVIVARRSCIQIRSQKFVFYVLIFGPKNY